MPIRPCQIKSPAIAKYWHHPLKLWYISPSQFSTNLYEPNHSIRPWNLSSVDRRDSSSLRRLPLRLPLAKNQLALFQPHEHPRPPGPCLLFALGRPPCPPTPRRG